MGEYIDWVARAHYISTRKCKTTPLSHLIEYKVDKKSGYTIDGTLHTYLETQIRQTVADEN